MFAIDCSPIGGRGNGKKSSAGKEPSHDAGSCAGYRDKEEVLETFTQLMRGEKTAEQMKAADALAKYHGLFAGKEDEAPRRPPEVAQAIDDAIAALSGKKRKSRKEVKPNE